MRRAGVVAIVRAAAAVLAALRVLSLRSLRALRPLRALLSLTLLPLTLLPFALLPLALLPLALLPLTLLPFALLSLLALALLALLPVLHALLGRLHASHEIAGLVRCARHGVLLRRFAHRRRRVADLLLQRVEVGADRLFHPARVLRALTLQRALRVADHFPDALVADAAGRFVELARRVALVLAHLVRHLLQLLLKIGDLRVHLLFALGERLRFRVAARARARLLERLHV